MRLIAKIKDRVYHFYRQRIVCEQYPMLTSISQKECQDRGSWGVVYMLHHITSKNPKGIPTNEDLKVSPEFLEKIILKYKKKGFDFISVDELCEIITSNKKPEHPFVSFTIDDGYLDNYVQALPVFERYQIPFAIFIATNFIDKKAILWWDILENLILKNDSIIVNNNEYHCRNYQEKWDVFRILRKIILSFDQKSIEEALKEMFVNYDIDWLEPVRRQAMSWEQVKEIGKHPLCTIGGHTVSHLALNQLNDEELCREVSEGILRLQAATGKPIYHFAYPYGSPNEIGEHEYRLISKFNFKTAFIAYGGCITEDNKTNITHLPRVYLHEQ